MWKAYSVFSDFNTSMCELLRKNQVEVTCSTGSRPNEQELIDLLYHYDIVIIGSEEKLTPTIFHSIARPCIIASLSTTVDHIDPIFFHSNFVQILYAETAHIISSAEYVIGMMILLEKRMIEANQSLVLDGGKKVLECKSLDLYQKTLGVIGIDKVAQAVIKMCSVFHMRILCYEMDLESLKELDTSIQLVELDTLLKESDIVTVHLPFTDSTKGFLSKEKLNLLKKDASYIHISNLEIVDIDFLMQLIANHHQFHVGLDLPASTYSSFFSSYPNLFITPGIASSSVDTVHRMDGEITHQILRILQNER